MNLKYLLRPYFKLNLFITSLEVILPFILIQTDYIQLFFQFFIGIASWNFLEYIYHYYIQHKYFYSIHKKHHDFPINLKYIHLSLCLTQCLIPFFSFIFWNNLYMLSGLCFGGIIFELCHTMSHKKLNGTIKKILFRNVKAYHKYHHLKSNVNFGFSTPSYDYLFGTLDKSIVLPNYILILGLFTPILLIPVDLKIFK